MKRGFFVPVPIEFFGPQNFNTFNIWKSFLVCNEEERNNYINFLPEYNSLNPLQKFIIGFTLKNEISELWLPSNCYLSILRKCEKILAEKGVNIIKLNYPPIKNFEYMRSAFEESLKRLQISFSEIETKVCAWQQIRNALKKLDGTHTYSHVLDSWTYVECLHSVLEPKEAIPQIHQRIEMSLHISLDKIKQRQNLMIGLLEFPPYIRSFYQTIEESGGIVVYDEMAFENFPLDLISDIVYLYLKITTPFGIKARRDKIKKEIIDRKIDALIFTTFNLADNSNNFYYFQRELKIPIHVYELKENERDIIRENNILREFLEKVKEDRKKTK